MSGQFVIVVGQVFNPVAEVGAAIVVSGDMTTTLVMGGAAITLESPAAKVSGDAVNNTSNITNELQTLPDKYESAILGYPDLG